jgi:tRNA pseudouridine38-40 synthase
VSRWALGLSYSGAAYLGWQSQPGGRTVQDRFEHALHTFIGADNMASPIRVNCAGRTDAGVHAVQQVIHFDAPVDRSSDSWVRGTNRYLPKDIAVLWARAVPLEFHARKHALCRRYLYRLLESPVRPSIHHAHVGWTCYPLDQTAMKEAADYLLGEHDFSSFRSSSCQSLSPIKNMQAIKIECVQELKNTGQGTERHWEFTFQANAFLHHMIRNLMGCLLEVGKHKRSPLWVKEVLEQKNRRLAAPTFGAAGLYFLGPLYDASWKLPADTSLSLAIN